MNELPQITGATASSNAYGLMHFQNLQQLAADNGFGLNATAAQKEIFIEAQRRLAAKPPVIATTTPQPQRNLTMATRLIQVFIADPNENVPLADRLLYTGEQKITDLTDQEEFFEVDIKRLLDKHNEKRVTLADKAVKERVQLLEAARIRDLKMIVVTVATF